MQRTFHRKNKCSQTWHDEDGQAWSVEYHYDGAYYPGTETDPPEYPELVIDAITSESTGADFGEPTDEIYNFINENHDGGEDVGCYHGED